jgi:hypothetical protein
MNVVIRQLFRVLAFGCTVTMSNGCSGRSSGSQGQPTPSPADGSTPDGSVGDAGDSYGAPVQIAAGQDHPYGIALDDHAVYWTARAAGRKVDGASAGRTEKSEGNNSDTFHGVSPRASNARRARRTATVVGVDRYAAGIADLADRVIAEAGHSRRRRLSADRSEARRRTGSLGSAAADRTAASAPSAARCLFIRVIFPPLVAAVLWHGPLAKASAVVRKERSCRSARTFLPLLQRRFR